MFPRPDVWLQSGLALLLAALLSSRTAPAQERPTLLPPIGVGQAASPLAPAASATPIDLSGALARAGAANATIARADEAVRASLAEQLQARALLLPSLDAGANYRSHLGNTQSAQGVIREVNLHSIYYGFGADAKGGGTVAVPGIRLVAHLADAVYAPQIAEEGVAMRRLDATATRNNILFEVGSRYLSLVEAQTRLRALRESEGEFGEIARLTASFAQAGQGRQSDAERARAELLLLNVAIERVQEEIAVAAADLARLLDLDPSLALQGIDDVPPRLELVDLATPPTELLALAVANNPEIQARGANVMMNQVRYRQERVRPWLPLVAVGFSAGEFGGGGSLAVERFVNARTDLDVIAVWSLQNLGCGNRAVQQRVRADVGQAEAERARVLERVRREVAEARAQALTRRQEFEVARRQLENAQRAYQLDLRRTKSLEGRPIEVLLSARLLADARQTMIQAVAAYSRAQLQLYNALGQAPPMAP
jgi:outer membrane protein TolC